MAALGELFSSQFKAAGNSGEGDSQDPPSVYIKQEPGEQKMSGTVDSFSEPFTLISSTAEALGTQAAEHANSRGFLGHISSGKDWIASKHSKVQPWAEFFQREEVFFAQGGWRAHLQAAWKPAALSKQLPVCVLGISSLLHVSIKMVVRDS